MALHYDELALLVNELQPLIGGQIQRIIGTANEDWFLQVRVPGQTCFIEIVLDSNLGRVCLRDTKPASAPTPSPFTMLMRKWLVGARLRAVDLDEHDRIVVLKFQRADEDTALVLELTGNQQNAILLHKNRVLFALRQDSRVTPASSYTRPSSIPEKTSPMRLRLPDEVRALTSSQSEDETESQTRENIRKNLNRTLKRVRRRAENIERDLQRIQDSESLRHRADLLQTVWGKVKRGQPSVVVLDYSNDMSELEIPLDPAKSLEDQVADLYHTYKRLKRARGLVEERYLEALDEIDTLTSMLDSLESLDVVALFDLKDHLHAKRVVRKPQTNETRVAPRRPFREFRTGKGRGIFVGRSAKDNDALNSRIARGNDIWMHARDWAGSHVILKTPAPPDGEDLLDAAILAAHFSKGRNDTSVEVTWTYAKHVRRVKGAPGRVTVAGGQTLLVSLEPSRLQRLLESEIIPA